MNKKIIRLTENDIKGMVKSAIREMMEAGGGFGFEDDYDDDDDYLNDFEIPDLPDSSAEFNGEGEETYNDEDSFDEPEFADVNNTPDRDSEFDDEEEIGSMDDFENDTQGPVTALSNQTPEEDEGAQYEDGDVLYYENIPIEKKDGRFYMTIEDGFEMGDSACPQITVVSNSLSDVKREYENLWNKWHYKDHGKYAEKMIGNGLGERLFDDQMPLDDGSKLEDIPVLIDLDKGKGFNAADVF